VSRWLWLYGVLTIALTALVMAAWRRLSLKEDGSVV
jgi:hypothetical protein